MKKFNILVKAEKVVDYTLVATDKSPKRLRVDVIPEMRKASFSILENIVRANLIDSRVEYDRVAERLKLQEECMVKIRILESFSEISKNRNYITEKQFNYLTKLTQELFDMVKKWRASDAEKMKQ